MSAGKTGSDATAASGRHDTLMFLLALEGRAAAGVAAPPDHGLLVWWE